MRISSISALLVLTTFIFSCKKDQPESSFLTEQEVYKVKQSIQFENTSENGLTYYWDFGDGGSSTLKNPGYTYTETGEYIVTLQVHGSKKTSPSEFNKTIVIVGENSNITEIESVFANTSWISDSTTQISQYCGGEYYDHSTNSVHHSMTFYNDNTVLMLNNGIGNICEYEVLNDTTIGFFEDPYYRTWSFSVTADRLTLTNKYTFTCPDGSSEDEQIETSKKHFYKD
jgi:PKD repeat protein